MSDWKKIGTVPVAWLELEAPGAWDTIPAKRLKELCDAWGKRRAPTRQKV